MKNKTLLTLALLVLMILAVACGGGDEASPESGRVDATGELVTNNNSTNQQYAPEATAPATYSYEGGSAEESADESQAATSRVVVDQVVVETDVAAEEAAVGIEMAPVEPSVATAPEQFFADYGVNPFVMTSVDNLSTFALDVDTGSYTIARNYLTDGVLPPPDAVRVEEFVNYFDQGYSVPQDAAFAVYADGAPSPFHNDGTHFLRIGIQGYDVPVEERADASLTFVIDVSGSMETNNRLEIVKESLQLLVEQLHATDQVAIVVYSSTPRVILEPTSGAEKSRILNAIFALRTEGSTNLADGLAMGYELANQSYIPGGINRVILASDGVANTGTTSQQTISSWLRGYADAGIQLTTMGVGMGSYNDVMMEQLADDGDGNYFYIDSVAEAEDHFVDNLMSTLEVIAIDAKVQVEFDPNVVAQYRLIGYENRAIADQDFRNDSVDAGEIGAGHTAVAIYAVQFVPGTEGRIATVSLRWEDPDSRQVQEIAGDFHTWDMADSFDEAPLHFQLAVVVSQFAELLRQSYWTDSLSFDDLRIRADRLATQIGGEEVVELAQLVRNATGR
ncbi:MAG: von Willebrand factor type A domain-containing protein [Ardenticatenales bacterium]|nr:von Willebrand factor type A domain-containing protein [Ardenticatenales bacterium]